uniref:Uncharacterized protein n=1 Tax=Lotus japonicus TaxID=34305 RepID=I3SQS3_LOTJA|nr:unknown [Lotus japonicus]
MPFAPAPFSPVHKALKFSTVFGTTWPYNPITSLPKRCLSTSISKNTLCVISGSSSIISSAVLEPEKAKMRKIERTMKRRRNRG